MTSNVEASAPQLFYSYCHADAQYRTSMEKALALLKRDGLLRQWSDQAITPGLSISSEIRNQIDQSEIMVFLLSPDYINSNECVKEWKLAKEMADSGKNLFRIPIVIRPCPWQGFLGEDDLLALPKDGRPVSQFEDADVAWQQVYEGIKSVIEVLRRTFSSKREYLEEINRTDFLSQSHLRLQDLYVFPRLNSEDPQSNEQQFREITVSEQTEVLASKYVLVHGAEKSGKTSLARHIYLSLVEASQPVLLLDLKQAPTRVTASSIRDAYHRQFHGDYSLWEGQNDKTLVVDDLNSKSSLLNYIDQAKDTFERIIITTSSDQFFAFFRDETRLAEFRQMQIQPLSHVQQEALIRKRIALLDGSREVTDGLVDQVEKRVNTIIVSERLLPRYPFYVLSILQTYEAYMPTSLSVTSYGHCYQALIVANLIQSGISGSDDDVNTCFNFTEHLAFQTFLHRKYSSDSEFNYPSIIVKYQERFIIRNSILSRLQSIPYGLIGEDGSFRTEFMYYYFLGRYLARNSRTSSKEIEDICANSHLEQNYLTLVFAIHHTNDDEIINDILTRTVCTLDTISPATLYPEETVKFGSIIQELPENILSDDPVEKVRTNLRETRDALNDQLVEELTEAPYEDDGLEDSELTNGIYRILRNTRIMGQVLRNRHGNLEKSVIEEIVEIIADSGLRLVNLVLEDDEEIARWASFIHEKNEEWDMEKIKAFLEYISFFWTMINIEQIVEAINIPEIRVAIQSVVGKNSTPAFELIDYFSRLESSTKLDEGERNHLRRLLRKHDDTFIQRVLSMKTQSYMNTHRSPAIIEQSICDLLKVKYRAHLPSEV